MRTGLLFLFAKFAPKLSVVEITGTCAHCQKAA
jgi:hypothetical protein